LEIAANLQSITSLQIGPLTTGGVMQVKTTVLLTPDEMDQATEKAVNFRPPDW
jgi:hypothetical protein